MDLSLLVQLTFLWKHNNACVNSVFKRHGMLLQVNVNMFFISVEYGSILDTETRGESVLTTR